MKSWQKKIKSCLLYLLAFSLTALPFADSTSTSAQSTTPLAVRYNGPGNSDDNGTAVAVDNSGNFYVAGSSAGSGTGMDYATIKYSPTGAQIWVKRYTSPGFLDDNVAAIAVDGFGNVYVTGASADDYATVKYSSNGTQLWVKRYNGPANMADSATAIAVDGSGNVYVTGSSTGPTSSYDYATVKYSSNGTQLWVKRYDGPAHFFDFASALKVDGSGNIYVTGESWSGSTGSLKADYATIKYSSTGNQLWLKRYNGPINDHDSASGLAIDSSGNVYVTGYSSGSSSDLDYATLKYSSSGTQLWAARYNGTGNHYDYAYGIGVDGSGNVYVTGTSSGGVTSDDCATVKYSPTGTQLWAKRFAGTSSSSVDDCRAVAADSSSNVYVTGESNRNVSTIKYSPTGTQLWIRSYNGPGNGDDYGRGIALDTSSNVYVTGTSVGGPTTIYDYVTIKYNTNGN